MILRKSQQDYLEHYSNAQRLGDKPLTQNYVRKTNGESVKYFSGIDAEIYFEGLYIDEITDIAFSVEQQAMPIFGYNSYIFDDIAVGSRLVNGQFAVNFTKAGYLYEVLDTMVALQTNESQRTTHISKRKPLWKNGFDLYVSYGNAKDPTPLRGSSVLVIRNVTLTSETQRFDYEGRPIQEVYTFVAQDIDFLNAGYATKPAPEEPPAQVEKEVTYVASAHYEDRRITLEVTNAVLEKGQFQSPHNLLWNDFELSGQNRFTYLCDEEEHQAIQTLFKEDGEVLLNVEIIGADRKTKEPVEIVGKVPLINVNK